MRMSIFDIMTGNMIVSHAAVRCGIIFNKSELKSELGQPIRS